MSHQAQRIKLRNGNGSFMNEHNQWYYTDNNKKTCGPIDVFELYNLFQTNVINKDTFVWNPKIVRIWAPLRSIVKLYELLKHENLNEQLLLQYLNENPTDMSLMYSSMRSMRSRSKTKSPRARKKSHQSNTNKNGNSTNTNHEVNAIKASKIYHSTNSMHYTPNTARRTSRHTNRHSNTQNTNKTKYSIDTFSDMDDEYNHNHNHNHHRKGHRKTHQHNHTSHSHSQYSSEDHEYKEYHHGFQVLNVDPDPELSVSEPSPSDVDLHVSFDINPHHNINHMDTHKHGSYGHNHSQTHSQADGGTLYPQHTSLSLAPAHSSPPNLGQMTRASSTGNNIKPSKSKPRKKYKETLTTQKLNYQIQKLQNDLEFQREKTKELQEQILTLQHQKRQREDAIKELANNVEQAHIAIDKLIQNDQTRKKLKCYIEIERTLINEDENGNENISLCVDNLCIAKLKFVDPSIDVSTVSIQWQRSFCGHIVPIQGANGLEYQLCADDIGGTIQCEVRLKDDTDCFEPAVLKSGAVKMSKICLKSTEQDLTQIDKSKEVQFEVIEENTGNSLILQFNRDKVKLRTPKNETIDKEQYNTGMKVELCTINPHRFTIKLASNKEYVIKAKSSLARDNIAILLRCCLEKLQRTNNKTIYEFYVISSDQKIHKNTLHSQSGNRAASGSGSDIMGDPESVISKLLAPITAYSHLHKLSLRKLKSYTNMIARSPRTKKVSLFSHASTILPRAQSNKMGIGISIELKKRMSLSHSRKTMSSLLQSGTIQIVTDEENKAINNLHARYTKTNKIIQAYECGLDVIEDECNKSERDIAMRFDEVIDKLQDRKQFLLNTIWGIKQHKMETINNQIEEFKKHKQDILNAKKEYDNNMKQVGNNNASKQEIERRKSRNLKLCTTVLSTKNFTKKEDLSMNVIPYTNVTFHVGDDMQREFVDKMCFIDDLCTPLAPSLSILHTDSDYSTVKHVLSTYVTYTHII